MDLVSALQETANAISSRRTYSITHEVDDDVDWLVRQVVAETLTTLITRLQQQESAGSHLTHGVAR